jgi:molecular chaperone Hsp33
MKEWCMSELHKFLFDGLPVRGAIVRLTDSWVEVLRRRASNNVTGAYPEPVRALLGEMTAAAVLMQSNIKFDGALVLQIFGDGPVQVAVAEVQSDFALRATAKVTGSVAPDGQSAQPGPLCHHAGPQDQVSGPAALPGRGAAV